MLFPIFHDPSFTTAVRKQLLLPFKLTRRNVLLNEVVTVKFKRSRLHPDGSEIEMGAWGVSLTHFKCGDVLPAALQHVLLFSLSFFIK